MKNLFLFMTIGLVFWNCKSPEKESIENQEVVVTAVTEEEQCLGSFAHNVYVWLKRPDSKEDQETFLTLMTRFLDESQYVVSSHVGAAVPSGRSVVDDSFSFAVLLTFKSKEDQDLYQEEEAHKQFIAGASHLWEKLVIYDSTNLLE